MSPKMIRKYYTKNKLMRIHERISIGHEILSDQKISLVDHFANEIWVLVLQSGLNEKSDKIFDSENLFSIFSRFSNWCQFFPFWKWNLDFVAQIEVGWHISLMRSVPMYYHRYFMFSLLFSFHWFSPFIFHSPLLILRGSPKFSEILLPRTTTMTAHDRGGLRHYLYSRFFEM